MSVQPAPPHQYFHGHPAQSQGGFHIHSNGAHAATKAQGSVYTNGHFNSEGVVSGDMNPYQQPTSYQHQYGYQQAQRYPPPQQRQQQQQQQQPPPPPPSYAQTQLPPIPGMQTTGMAVPPIDMATVPVPGSLASAYSSNPVSYAPQPAGFHPAMPQLPPAQTPSQQQAAEKPPIQLSHTGYDDKYSYTLIVEQQPQRARMCGFGDKDRRPITPPPCVRLVIADRQTGKEVDFDAVEGTFFVLQVDLWDEKGQREVNIVRASTNTPAMSISNASTTSFPPQQERPAIVDNMTYNAGMSADAMGYSYHRPSMGYPYAGGNQMYSGVPAQYAPQQSNSAMYTRNLIGSLTVNAARLKNNEDKEGFWFVLQDLSVRTEGFFRLKMNFIDVGARSGQGLNRGKAPVLAWVFSDTFQVYSAKKFPGVIESTPLSKRFATQGIKIPIRKDTKGDTKNEEDEMD